MLSNYITILKKQVNQQSRLNKNLKLIYERKIEQTRKIKIPISLYLAAVRSDQQVFISTATIPVKMRMSDAKQRKKEETLAIKHQKLKVLYQNVSFQFRNLLIMIQWEVLKTNQTFLVISSMIVLFLVVSTKSH